jgi:hypothetical protein
MDTETPDAFDIELQQLFAGAVPDAGFEQRMVNAVRVQRRWSILRPMPAQVRRAAIAAAAVLMVGSIGYFGNRSITGGIRFGKSAGTTSAAWDFGGGSGSAQNWTNWNAAGASSLGARKRVDSYNNRDSILLPFAGENYGDEGRSRLSTDSRLADREVPASPDVKKQPRYDFAFKPSEIDSRTGKSDLGINTVASAGGKVSGLNYFHGSTNGVFDSTVDHSKDSEIVAGGILKSQAVINAVTSDNQTDALNAAEAGKRGPSPFLAATTSPTTAPAFDTRKIIRNGTMEFEVDRFDSAQVNITKIVSEMGGFVGTTESTKLPNGKVRGSIALRIPPERLDALVLSLRALGDLKSQQITAADITKEYTDLESELTTDRAMQDRLLELIHNGKGSVKDLLAAENELGTWRGKIEKTEGQIRYYNGLVAMSTLTITLAERDIQTPATAIETETADIGIEAEDVEKARNTAMKSIDDAHGRIVAAELKRYDAGQLAAQITADVPPDAAGALIDQLKLLGKVARLEVHRQETASDGSPAANITTPIRIERKPARLLISIYNLANVAPRRTTNINLAAADVEAAFNALLKEAKTDGGRVVTSNLDRGDPVKATGSVVIEIPPEKLEAATTALHAAGDVLKLTLTENADTQNSTEAKQGLTVQLVSLASVPARETVQQTIAAVDVPVAYQAIINAAESSKARTLTAQLNEQDRHNISADVQLEVLRSQLPALDKAIAAAGDTIGRTSSRTADADGTVDSKVLVKLSISSADHLNPRETTKLQAEVPDVDKAAGDAQAVAVSLGGRMIDATVTNDHGKGIARVAIDVPLDKSQEALRQIRSLGILRGIDASRDTQAPTGPLAHAQIFVEFATGDALVTDDTGPWASVHHGLSTSINALLWSLQWVVVGICLIGPFATIAWIISRVWRSFTRSRADKPAATP